MPFGYTTINWAALSESQKIAAVFAQLDDNLVFVGNPTKANLFAEAGNYLLIHRPLSSTTQTRTQVYANLEARVKNAEQIAGASSSVQNQRSSFIRMMGLT
jgi:hypothetical protein